MKFLLLALTVSLVSQASTIRTTDLTKGLDADQVERLASDVPHFYKNLKNCKAEDQQKVDKINHLKEVTYVDNRNGYGLSVKGGGSYPQPSGRKYEVVATVYAERVRDNLPPRPDAPGRFKYSCDVKVKDLD